VSFIADQKVGKIMPLLNAIVNGIFFGGSLALLAYGLNLCFGVLNIIHFFYGQSIMLGLYIVFTLTVWFHIPLIVSCLVAVAAILALHVLVHLGVVQPLLKAPLINQFLALASIMIILENTAMGIWGATYRGVPIALPVLSIGELYIRTSNLIAFLGCLVVVGLLYLFLNKTYTGLAIRITAQDTEMASIMGVKPRRIYLITLALVGVLAGVAAAFFVLVYAVHPFWGGAFTLMAFVIVVLGGLGNLAGGFLAALIIGVVTMVASFLTIPEGGPIAAYLIFLVVILFRPQGLLGVRGRA
jgi:branched-chain amino acid transport system permease protein